MLSAVMVPFLLKGCVKDAVAPHFSQFHDRASVLMIFFLLTSSNILGTLVYKAGLESSEGAVLLFLVYFPSLVYLLRRFSYTLCEKPQGSCKGR